MTAVTAQVETTMLTAALEYLPHGVPVFPVWGVATVLGAFGIVVAPFVEEVVFRGYLYPVLARAWGTSAGILATALLFAAIHAQQLWGGWAQIALILLVGLILTYVRARNGSVLASYLVHLSYNLTVFLLIWVATDFFRKLPMK